jgi:hypothetical protein
MLGTVWLLLVGGKSGSRCIQACNQHRSQWLKTVAQKVSTDPTQQDVLLAPMSYIGSCPPEVLLLKALLCQCGC